MKEYRNYAIAIYVMLMASWLLMGNGGITTFGVNMSFKGLDWTSTYTYGKLLILMAMIALLILIYKLDICKSCHNHMDLAIFQKKKCECKNGVEN